MAEFIPTFPCFIQLMNDCLHPMGVSSNGVLAIVILTDDDLRQRFAAELDLKGPAVRFTNPMELAFYLERMKVAFQTIAFDPTKGKIATFEQTEHFIQRLRTLN